MPRSRGAAWPAKRPPGVSSSTVTPRAYNFDNLPLPPESRVFLAPRDKDLKKFAANVRQAAQRYSKQHNVKLSLSLLEKRHGVEVRFKQ